MKTTKLNVEIEFTSQVLGSTPGNKEITEEFISSKAPTETMAKEEVACVVELLEKGTTVFPRNDRGLFLWDYQVKGFLKESIGVLAEMGDVELSKWTYKRVVDSCVFVTPRIIYLLNEEGNHCTEAYGFNERPLRAETMQGDRVALARSEFLPAGTKAIFEVTLLESSNKKSKFMALSADVIREALNYGQMKGMGQWRNGGNGSFKWKELAK